MGSCQNQGRCSVLCSREYPSIDCSINWHLKWGGRQLQACNLRRRKVDMVHSIVLSDFLNVFLEMG